MRYYISTRLSEHISETPEGYLLCRAVPIARTGVLEYAANEVPEDVAAGHDVVRVIREAEDLFSPAAMASFEGKPLTIDHPEKFLNPENWRKATQGHMQNVRRGQGVEDDLLLADILVMDAGAIALVRKGLRELSCGYDADFEVVQPGVGRQKNFEGNHVALVDKGRCGSRCAIKDKAREETMGKSFFDRIWGNPKVRRAVRDAEAEELKTGDEDTPSKTADEEGEQSAPAPATDGDDAMAALAQSMDEIKLLLRGLAEKGQGTGAQDEESACDEDGQTANSDSDTPAEDEDVVATDEEGSPVKTGDRHRMADADTLKRAARLAPALRFRAGDSALLVQRAALRSGMGDAEVARVVTACLGRRTLDSAAPALLNAAFVAAAQVAASRNTRRTADALTSAKSKDGAANGAPTPASINALNRDFYGKK